jgi:hypothetical protein
VKALAPSVSVTLAAFAVVAGCESSAAPPPQAPSAPEATVTTPQAPMPPATPSAAADAGLREPAAVYGGPPPR